jgi:hypothetical protein
MDCYNADRARPCIFMQLLAVDKNLADRIADRTPMWAGCNFSERQRVVYAEL